MGKSILAVFTGVVVEVVGSALLAVAIGIVVVVLNTPDGGSPPILEMESITDMLPSPWWQIAIFWGAFISGLAAYATAAIARRKVYIHVTVLCLVSLTFSYFINLDTEGPLVSSLMYAATVVAMFISAYIWQRFNRHEERAAAAADD